MEHAAAKTTAGNEHLVKVIYPKYTIKRAEIIGWHACASSNPQIKVIREKSCGEGSLIEQDTIENVSEPNFSF